MSRINYRWPQYRFFLFFLSTVLQSQMSASFPPQKSDICMSLKPGMNVRLASSAPRHLWYCLFCRSSILPAGTSHTSFFSMSHLCKVWGLPPTQPHPPSKKKNLFAIVCSVWIVPSTTPPPPPACKKKKREKSVFSVDSVSEYTDFTAVLKSVRAEGYVYQRSMCGAPALWPSFRCNGSHMRRGRRVRREGWARVELGEGRGHSDHLLIKTTLQHLGSLDPDLLLFSTWHTVDMPTSYRRRERRYPWIAWEKRNAAISKSPTRETTSFRRTPTSLEQNWPLFSVSPPRSHFQHALHSS